MTEGKPPINVKFEIPYFTTSGIQVSLLMIICSLLLVIPLKHSVKGDVLLDTV